MSEVTQSVFKAGKVLESLFKDDFKGKTITEIGKDTGVDPQSVRRSLLTWKALGWVVETPVSGSKQGCWKVSTKLAGIAHAYERYALSRIQGVRREYREVTGRELSA